MHIPSRRLALPAGALAICTLAICALALPAQDRPGTNVLIQPTGSSYTFGEGSTARTVEQVSLPMAFIFPIHRRFTLDLTTAAAYTRVVHGDSTVSEIYGATDTQLRANIQVMMDRLMLTLGVNGPSGQYFVDSTQLEAAGRIGNDFLAFPISSMGNGPAGTVGLAGALPLLGFNLGVGASLRKSFEFVPYGSGTGEITYQPGDEMRLRLSAERALWLGTASLGVTLSSFGDEVANSTTYSTGDRVITTLGWSVPIKKAELGLGLWNLSRDAGTQFSGPAPKENIRNLSGVLRVPLGRWAFQPVAESRQWRVSGDKAGSLTNYGISISIPIGETRILQPSFTSSSGTLYSLGDATRVGISGWQGSLLIRRR